MLQQLQNWHEKWHQLRPTYIFLFFHSFLLFLHSLFLFFLSLLFKLCPEMRKMAKHSAITTYFAHIFEKTKFLKSKKICQINDFTYSNFDLRCSSFAFIFSAFSFSSFSFFSRFSRSSFSFFSRFSFSRSSFNLRASSFFFSFAALTSSFCRCFSCCSRIRSSCSCKL